VRAKTTESTPVWSSSPQLAPSRALTTDWVSNAFPFNTESTSKTKRAGSPELIIGPSGALTATSRPVNTTSAAASASSSFSPAQLHADTEPEENGGATTIAVATSNTVTAPRMTRRTLRFPRIGPIGSP